MYFLYYVSVASYVVFRQGLGIPAPSFFMKVLHPTFISYRYPASRAQFWRISLRGSSQIPNPTLFLVKSRIHLASLKAVHKALYSNTWPQSLRLEKVKHTRTLRSSSQINLVTPLTRNTFQECAATVFHSLPTEVKSCVDPKSFSKQTFEILRNRSLNK